MIYIIGGKMIFNKSIFILFIAFFIFSSYVGAYSTEYKSSDYDFDINIVFSSSNTTIDLISNGISIGQELLWKASTTGTNYEESAVAYVDGIAYIGSCSTHGDGYDKLFAVDTSSGIILWSTYTGPGYVGPVIDNDVIYIGTSAHGWDPGNQHMYAINRFTGEVIWKVKIYAGIAESVQYDESKIYFAAGFDGRIYALNKNDGSVNWTFDTYLDVCPNKPMLKDNCLYVAYFKESNYGGKLFKINASDGSIIWDVIFPSGSGPWDNSITSDSQGRIFLTRYYSSTIYCFDEFDGSLIWSYNLHGRSLSFNAYHDGIVFISDTFGYIYALDGISGNLIWENQVAGNFDISSPTISGGLIFIGSRDFFDGAFYVIDEKTGELLWKYTIGASITAPPSIADGMMLCGTDGWDMYCFDFGLGDDDWLLHRYDSLNTAYSPRGLTEWQYVQADCSNSENIINCVITNFYDHNISDIVINLWDDVEGYWYDSLGNMISSKSDSYTIDNIEAKSKLILFISEIPVSAPLKPNVPEGPTSGRVGVEYSYNSSCIDPDGDNLYYIWDWGDGSFSDWLGPYESGDIVSASHLWIEQNSYQIKVRTKDVKGLLSDWSDPIHVSMPKIKIISGFNFSLYKFFEIFTIFKGLFD
jgi:outer membrane protein assembly factor BamB